MSAIDQDFEKNWFRKASDERILNVVSFIQKKMHNKFDEQDSVDIIEFSLDLKREQWTVSIRSK